MFLCCYYFDTDCKCVFTWRRYKSASWSPRNPRTFSTEVGHETVGSFSRWDPSSHNTPTAHLQSHSQARNWNALPVILSKCPTKNTSNMNCSSLSEFFGTERIFLVHQPFLRSSFKKVSAWLMTFCGFNVLVRPRFNGLAMKICRWRCVWLSTISGGIWEIFVDICGERKSRL